MGRQTYTSHGFIKKGNRKSEILLRDAEYLATLAVLIGKDKSYVYPRKELDECWENLLLCQVRPPHSLAHVARALSEV